MIEFNTKQRKAIGYASKHGDCPYTHIAEHIGVDTSTLFRYRQNSTAFAEALENARQGISEVEQTPVGIEEFVRSKDYLGLGIHGIDQDGRVYPKVMEELQQICSGDYDLVILAGGLGSAKTYSATVAIVYQLYKLLLLDNPHKTYDLDSNTAIIIGLQNRSRKLAERNAYGLARNLITNSAWFQQYAPWHERLKSGVKFIGKNIEVWAASGDATDLLGMNLFSLILDESNFFARVEKSKRAIDGRTYDAAREAFESALRRKQSRFHSGGQFFVSSSRRFKGQFTDQLEKEYADDPRCYRFNHSEWSIRPELYEDSKWFHVFIGDRMRPPRVLAADEETSAADRELLIKIPERFRRRFESDPVRSLQDLAGISTVASGGFFQDRERLNAAACLPNILVCKADAIADASELLPLPHSYDLPCPTSPRAVHGDLSLTGDLTGLAIGHIRRYNDRGLPEIGIDGLARIYPPRNGQIILDSIYQLIAGWKALGIPIEWVSFDGYQSADLIQRIGRLGIRTGRLSVDQTSPGDPLAAYECLRAGISEGRFRFPADAETVRDMLALQADYQKQRVDYLPNMKKDVSDCLAAICFHLTHQINSWAYVGKIEGAGFAAAMSSRLGGQVTGIPYPVGTDMEIIRIQRGIGSATY